MPPLPLPCIRAGQLRSPHTGIISGCIHEERPAIDHRRSYRVAGTVRYKLGPDNIFPMCVHFEVILLLLFFIIIIIIVFYFFDFFNGDFFLRHSINLFVYMYIFRCIFPVFSKSVQLRVRERLFYCDMCK